MRYVGSLIGAISGEAKIARNTRWTGMKVIRQGMKKWVWILFSVTLTIFSQLKNGILSVISQGLENSLIIEYTIWCNTFVLALKGFNYYEFDVTELK